MTVGIPSASSGRYSPLPSFSLQVPGVFRSLLIKFKLALLKRGVVRNFEFMRNSINRLEVKKLFIFGAGVTYSISSRNQQSFKEAPLDSNFISKLLEIDVKKPKWVKPSIEYIVDQWKDEEPIEKFGLEEAIITQNSHLEFIEAIHKNRRNESVTPQSYLSNLSHLICYLLSRVRENRNSLLENFISKFFANNNTKNRIITFNYDKIIDEYLLGNIDPKEMYFDEIKENRSDNSHLEFESPILLKLHGSINWRCHEDDFNNIINAEEENHRIPEIWIDNRNRPSVNDERFPLIIPPLPQKPITRVKLFQYLWTKAFEYLFEAEEIIIAGYSLPDADGLANSMFRTFKSNSLKIVTIIDPNTDILAKWRSVIRRGNVPSCSWRYYEDFNEYIKQNA